MKYPKRLQLYFARIPPRFRARMCARSLDRMKKSSGKHAYGNGGCIMKTTRSLRLALFFHIYRRRASPRFSFTRESESFVSSAATRGLVTLSNYPSLISYSPSRKRRVTLAHFITTYAPNMSNFLSRRHRCLLLSMRRFD